MGLRPAQALPTADGGLEVRVYDWATGEMVPDPSWLSIVLGQTDKDVDEVSEAEFAAISAGEPWATIRPPWIPAPGPISTT